MYESKYEIKHEALLATALASVIEKWCPDHRPVHCSNCLHAKVTGEWPTPVVVCDVTGKSRELRALLRSQRPYCFKAAQNCPDYDAAG